MDKALARKKAAKIKMLLLDVDGIMTDGRFYLDSAGKELKPFCSKDGVAIKLLEASGITVGFITGRNTPATRARAKELGVNEVFVGKLDKVEIFEEIIERHGLKPAQVAYMGDDLPDLPILRRVGLPATVPDGVPEVKKTCLYVTSAAGGSGAVREFAEFVLKTQKLWKKLVERFNE